MWYECSPQSDSAAAEPSCITNHLPGKHMSLSGRVRPVRLAVALSVGAAVYMAPEPALAQNPETTPRERAVKDAAQEPGRVPISKFGAQVSDAEGALLLQEMSSMVEQALAASRAAERAGSVAEVKAAAAQVSQMVWGVPATVAGEGVEPVGSLGWKERWQVTGGEFDPNFVARYGKEPPRVTDPRQLGVMGRGRAVRGWLERVVDAASAAPAARKAAAQQTMASVNNVIGWMYMTVGFKGKEVQPRISLTHVWDAPAVFWQGTADTGWLPEAYSQAVNILKTDYQGDVEEARRHAAGMTALLQKVLQGVDADRNGTVEASVMEGGLGTALAQARTAGLAR
jgi:hypothetical protein